MKRWVIRFFTALFAFIYLIPVVYSDFLVLQNDKVSTSKDFTISSKQAVCYIEGGLYYTSIEKALEVAGSNSNADTIYVIPDNVSKNVTITRNCTIAKEDTLILPYEGTSWDNREGKGGFADSSSNTVKANRKTLVTISEGISLINNGTISIGGILGTGNPLSGCTSSSYAEILMKKNSLISNNGTINCFGYIKEDSLNNSSAVINNSNAIFYTPIVVYDFRGGEYTLGCYKIEVLVRNSYFKVMPFEIFDLPNCQVNLNVKTGAKLNGTVTFTMSNQLLSASATVIGTSSDSAMFKLTSGEIVLKYTPNTVGITTNDCKKGLNLADANRTQILVRGDLTLSSFQMDMKGIPVVGDVTIDTSKFFLPICYKFDISIASGANMSIDSKIKFLSGSTVYIQSGGTANINAETGFYQNYVQQQTTGGDFLPSSLGPSLLINDGTINLNANFGGKIRSTTSNAVIICSNEFSPSVTILEKETDNEVDKVENAVIDLVSSQTYVQGTDTDFVFVSKSLKIDQKLNFNTKYTSCELADKNLSNYNGFAWNTEANSIATTYEIRYDGMHLGEFSSIGDSVALTKQPDKDNMSFDGYYYDNGLTNALSYDQSTDKYYLDPQEALEYIQDGNNYLELYANYSDPNAGSFTVETIKTTSTNHLDSNISNSTTTYNVGTQNIALPDTQPGYYTYTELNKTGGTGKLNEYTFVGYEVTATDASGNAIDLSYDSTNYIIDTNAIEDGYKITVRALYQVTSTDFSIYIQADKDELSKQETINISVKSDNSIIDGRISDIQWSADNDKAIFGSSTSKNNTVKNNYTGSLRDKDVNLTCQLTLDGITGFNLSKKLTFQKGLLE